jgi:hypothetical protein
LPAASGTVITWTATATGGASLQYQFWLYNYTTGIWTLAQPYSTNNQLTWTAGTPSTYLIVVWAKSQGSPAEWEAYLGIDFVITP